MLGIEKKKADIVDLRQTAEDNDLLGALNKEFAARIDEQKENFRQWMTNIAFFQGRHWGRYDRFAGQYVELRPRVGDRLRITINLILSSCMDLLALLSQSMADCDVLPASDSPEDEYVAKSATVHLRRIEGINDSEAKRAWLSHLMLIFGLGYRFVTWDPQGGKTVPIVRLMESEKGKSKKEGKEKIPAHDEEGEYYLDSMPEGEVDEQILAPFEALLPVGHKPGMPLRNFMRPHLMPIDEIRERWENGKFVTQDIGSESYSIKEITRGLRDYYDTSDPEREPYLVKEFFEEKNEQFPQGRFIQWCGNVLLYSGPLPHREGKICLFDYHLNTDKYNFYNVGHVEPLIPIQVAINRIVTFINEWLVKKVRWVVAMPKLAKISKQPLFGAQTGDIAITYPGVYSSNPVQSIAIDDVPTGVFKFLDICLGMFDRIAHQSEALRGQAPGRVDSAAGISALQEADIKFLIPIANHIEAQDRKVAITKLEFARDYYDNTRVAQVIGEDKDTKIYKLKGADLSPHIDVSVTKGSALPKSKAAQSAYYLQVAQLGVLGDLENDPEARKKFLRALDLKGLAGMFGEINQGFDQQHREIEEMIETGELIEVQPYHDDYAANIVLVKFMNSKRYEKLKRDRPERAKIILEHWNQHIAAIQEQFKGIEQSASPQARQPGRPSPPARQSPPPTP